MTIASPTKKLEPSTNLYDICGCEHCLSQEADFKELYSRIISLEQRVKKLSEAFQELNESFEDHDHTPQPPEFPGEPD